MTTEQTTLLTLLATPTVDVQHEDQKKARRLEIMDELTPLYKQQRELEEKKSSIWGRRYDPQYKHQYRSVCSKLSAVTKKINSLMDEHTRLLSKN